jgi:hypothetical protein
MIAIDEYTALHMLKVKGFASAEAVGASIGVGSAEVEPVLVAAVESGNAKQREGRLAGFALTVAGRERHDELRQSAVSTEQADQLTAAYEAFLAPNREFKQLTTDWQLRAEGADIEPLLARLDSTDAIVHDIVATAVGANSRFAVYGVRFASALLRLKAGDATAFARPMSDSYHDVWMELHEDLVASLGHARTEADE